MDGPADRRGGSWGWWYKICVFCSVFQIQDWISSKSYHAFRYSMVFLYIGTMLVVLGYHNSWLNFVKYVGLGLVIVGCLTVGYAMFDFCSKCYSRRSILINPELYPGQIQTISSRLDSADSKKGLPSYDIVAGYELPTYEEAEELRLHPGKIPDEYFRRLSIVQSSVVEAIRNPNDGTTVQLPVFPGNFFAQLESQRGVCIQVQSQDEETLDNESVDSVQLPRIQVENFGPGNSSNQSGESSSSSGFSTDSNVFLNPSSSIHLSQTYPQFSRKLRRSSELSHIQSTENEDVLRRLRRSISSRPQTSRLQYSSVIESDEESVDACEIRDLSHYNIDPDFECRETDWDFGNEHVVVVKEDPHSTRLSLG